MHNLIWSFRILRYLLTVNRHRSSGRTCPAGCGAGFTGRSPGHIRIVDKLNRFRELKPASSLLQKIMISFFSSSVGSNLSCSTTMALTASPHFSSGTPITAMSLTAGCSRWCIRLRRIHLFAAGDDHIGLSIHQEVIAVRIPAGHIPGRRPSPAKAAFVFSGSFRYSLKSIGVR